MTAASELELFSKTGHFLAGRLWQDMSDAEKAELEALAGDVQTFEDGHRLISHGDVCDCSTMLIDEFMLRTLESEDRRYGGSFHVPGDFVDLHCFALKRLDHYIDCVGPTKIAQVPHTAIANIMHEKPHLARLFWFSTLLDAAMHREWTMKLEQLTAPKRIAHIFAEIWRRLEMIGLGYPDGFETPLTQADIATMCGATPIHTNRALSDSRKQGFVDFQRVKVRIEDRQKLEDYAGFTPDHLYGEGELVMRRIG